MTLALDIYREPDCELALADDELAHALELVLAHEGVSRPCRVSVSVVSERRMREANLEWRGVDAPTDVISLECERPDDPTLAPGEPCELGDVLIAPAIIERQAAEAGVSAADETCLMAIHSLLHLLGYDHMREEDAAVMEALEDELWAQATGRALTHVATTRHEGEGGLEAKGGDPADGGLGACGAAGEGGPGACEDLGTSGAAGEGGPGACGGGLPADEGTGEAPS